MEALNPITSNQISKKAVIYIRVSSEEQVENYSLGTQEEICRREATRRGYEVVQVFREEGRSAKTITGRPELLKMLEFLRKNKKTVQAMFVYRLDRLSRQTSDYLAIRKRLYDAGVSIISANEPTGNSPTEKLLETILASFAQHDNDVRSERTKNGLRARFLSGLVANHVPLGYLNKGGYAVKDPETWDLYKKAWDLMATGTKSLREMDNIMKGWGLKIGGPQTVHHMFRNKFYMGMLTCKKYPEEIRGQHIPMITKEQFYAVQAILDGRCVGKPLMPKNTRENKDFPLRVIAKCGKCGTPFTGAWSKHHRYAYYFCRKRCVNNSVPISDLHNDLLNLLGNIRATDKAIDLYCNFLLKTYNKHLSKLQKIRRTADEEIAKLYAMRQVLVEKNLAGIYSDEIFKEQNSVIEEKLKAAYVSQNDEILEKYDINKITECVKEKLSDLPATFSASKDHISQVRSLLGSIFASGFSWGYPGCSNYTISPLYQEIRNADKQAVDDSCRTWIRTKINGSKVRCPTIRRSGNDN